MSRGLQNNIAEFVAVLMWSPRAIGEFIIHRLEEEEKRESTPETRSNRIVSYYAPPAPGHPQPFGVDCNVDYVCQIIEVDQASRAGNADAVIN